MNAVNRLDKRINELNVLAKKSLGQNFLISDFVIDQIIKATTSFTFSHLLEIGPGCGALTDLLIEKYKTLTVIELDRVFVEYWKTQNIQVIEGDALRIDWSFAKDHFLVSNLPYQISSSLVIERSMDSTPLIGMVLMFQKEVAQRIRALCQSEHYGMLSVIAQEFWTIETVCDAGPRDFRPAPKVASRVLKFNPKNSNISDKQKYLLFIKSCFQQRRRVLTNNLKSFDMQLLMEWLKLNNKSEKIRAEELSPIEFNQLFHFLHPTNLQR